MIHYLKITNFGAVKDEVEMNFEAAEIVDDDDYQVVMPDGRVLLKLAYIYGANASGKTTVLKAFDFLRNLLLRPAGDKSLELGFEPFLFRDLPYSHNTHFELSFYVEGMRYIYEISCNKQSVLAEKLMFYQTAKPTELFSRTTDVEKRLATVQFGSRIKVSAREKDLLESNTIHNITVIGAYSRTNVDIPELEKLHIWFSGFLAGMITSAHNLTEVTTSLIDENPTAAKWLNAFLHKADDQIAAVDISDFREQVSILVEEVFPKFEGKFHPQGSYARGTSIKTSSSTTTTTTTTSKYYGGGASQRKIDFIHKLNEKSYALPILRESSGTKRYFGLAGPLYSLIHNSCLLCIDELETSLHPDLMKSFLQMFLLNARSSQLLVTTHNISLMENQDFIRRDALWFSEKKDDGSVSLYSASDFDTNVLRKDASIVNAYRTGKLGAKPNLGSPYLVEE